jgi:peptidoglycan hydrolase CwlO-like protein
LDDHIGWCVETYVVYIEGEFISYDGMAGVQQDSLEHDTKPEEQKTIQRDIDFLKKKVLKLERQLMETRDLSKENQRNVDALQQVCGVVEVKPLPEL